MPQLAQSLPCLAVCPGLSTLILKPTQFGSDPAFAACVLAGTVLRQLATACGSYLPPAAREAMLAAAKQLPAHGAALGDSADALAREMRDNPLQAAAHEASEL